MRPAVRHRVDALRRHPAAGEVGASALALLVVRALGLAGQAVVLATFGAGADLDAFYLALIVPNLLSVPVAAAAELALAPSVTRVAEGGRDGLTAFRRWALVRAAWIAAVIGVAVTAAAPLGVHLSAPGVGGDAQSDALDLGRLLYPSVAPLILSGVASAVLIGLGRFTVPVVVQGVRPVAMLLAVVVTGSPTVQNLAVGVLVGSVVEAAASVVACLRIRVPARAGASQDLAAERSATLRGMRAFVPGAAGYQITPIVDQVVVAGLGPGTLVKYLLAVRFFDVSKQVLIQPVVRVAQNRLSAATEPTSFRAAFLTVLRRSGQAGLLSAVLLCIGGPVAILVLFTNGEFATADGLESVRILLVLAGALVPFALNITMSRALGVLGRAATGAWLMVSYTVINVVLDVAFAQWLGVYGVALATVVSLAVGTSLSFVALGVPVRQVIGAMRRNADASRSSAAGEAREGDSPFVQADMTGEDL